MKLKVNEEKTKYIIVTGNGKQPIVEPYITITEQNLTEYVDLRTWAHQLMREMTKRVNTNKSYYRLQRHLKSRLVTYEIKVMIYKTLVITIPMDGSENRH